MTTYVCTVSLYVDKADSPSAAQTRVLEINNVLRRHGCDAEVITPDEDSGYKWEPVGDDGAHDGG